MTGAGAEDQGHALSPGASKATAPCTASSQTRVRASTGLRLLAQEPAGLQPLPISRRTLHRTGTRHSHRHPPGPCKDTAAAMPTLPHTLQRLPFRSLPSPCHSGHVPTAGFTSDCVCLGASQGTDVRTAWGEAHGAQPPQPRPVTQSGYLGSVTGAHTCIHEDRAPGPEGGALFEGQAQPTGSLPQDPGWQVQPRYLVHLAVVLLVVGWVVWDLGSVRGACVESTVGNTSLPHRTPGQGRHSRTWGAPGLRPLSHWCLREPSGHHPHGPPPTAPPTPGKHHWAPLELERAGWEGHLCPGEALTAPRLTCETRRNSCAFCKQDEHSGLWCAPAWKREDAEPLAAGTGAVGGVWSPDGPGDVLPPLGTGSKPRCLPTSQDDMTEKQSGQEGHHSCPPTPTGS